MTIYIYNGINIYNRHLWNLPKLLSALRLMPGPPLSGHEWICGSLLREEEMEDGLYCVAWPVGEGA